MAAEQQRLTAAERSNLVAYLDGELEESESQAIAAKLTRSVSARHEVEMLTATWELLDGLPHPEPSHEFKDRTVSMAIQASALEDRWLSLARGVAQRLGRLLVVAVVALVMLGVGYSAARWLLPDPSARLARDLSIAEHLDEYRAVGDLDFVQRLDNSTLLGNVDAEADVDFVARPDPTQPDPTMDRGSD